MTKRPSPAKGGAGKVVSEGKPGEAAQPKQASISMRRFIGVHSLTHEDVIYQAGPDGVLELPEGDTWYHPLVELGILQEVAQ